MNFLSQLFRKQGAVLEQEDASVLDSGNSQFAASQGHPSKPPRANPHATRKEMLRMVLRDVLKRHGIPAEWIVGEALAAMSRRGTPGLYWRLTIRHWDARLPNHCVALQDALLGEVQLFDPAAERWLLGLMWQFAPEDDTACPQLPAAGTWAGPPSEELNSDLMKLMSTLDADQRTAQSEATTQPNTLQ
ncbi:hypothetical protein [Ramlibacter albus]|uniref:Uncharacterized protein n=1 Tax=Ramlibacter albus TaxID=2079448 RepID=A0A923MET3_9BURK|nr:hypothetical protein [Ramlibacter albus]MBC5768266.1 hypothetical protein [Ramlibacter albus]